MAVSEETLTRTLAGWLRITYPDILFHIDFGSGTKLTKGQAIKQSQLNRRGWPDVFIAEPRGRYIGMFLELKRDGKNPFKKNGELRADEHVQEQAQYLQELSERGYFADFAVGLDNAIELITEYLGKPESSGSTF